VNKPLLEVRGLGMHFPVRGGVFRRVVGRVHAVDDVNFVIHPGETLGLVGESGCGKSTVGKTLLRLLKGFDGEIWFDGQPVHQLGRERLKALRRDIQIVFQDPMESLNPRHTVGEIIAEPLVIHRWGDHRQRRDRVVELARRVGLGEAQLHRYPHEFSGGQRQRVGIARAIALQPRLLVCDEPVSALDVSIQSQIINLLLELQREMQLAMLFISHDLSVVKHVSDRVAVMYLGEIVEVAPAQQLYTAPRHPYTRALLDAVPQPDPSIARHRQPLGGEPPSPIAPPAGCRFHPRCPHADDTCERRVPAPDNPEPSHEVRCHHWRRLMS